MMIFLCRGVDIPLFTDRIEKLGKPRLVSGSIINPQNGARKLSELTEFYYRETANDYRVVIADRKAGITDRALNNNDRRLTELINLTRRVPCLSLPILLGL
jgi:hypothetical protein